MNKLYSILLLPAILGAFSCGVMPKPCPDGKPNKLAIFAAHHHGKLPKLGKLHPDNRKKVWLRDIVRADLPCPASFDNRGQLTDWGMDGNDAVGNCTTAGLEHGVKTWRQMRGLPDAGITTQQVLDLYGQFTGWDPSNPATDRGAVEADVLNKAWRQGFFGRKIQGYAAIGLRNRPHLMWAGANLGLLYLGVQLPVSAQDQDVWDVTDCNLGGDSAPGSWGGHCVIVVAASADGLWVVTWGQLKFVTWKFYEAYVDEVWIMIPPAGDFFTPDGKAPDGLDEATLKTLMKQVRNTERRRDLTQAAVILV